MRIARSLCHGVFFDDDDVLLLYSLETKARRGDGEYGRMLNEAETLVCIKKTAMRQERRGGIVQGSVRDVGLYSKYRERHGG